MPADLVLLNAKVVTLESGAPDAQAIAIAGSRIAAIGSSADMKPHAGPKTQFIDLKGQLVIPGFMEGHGHFTGVGTAQLQLNLMKVKSWDEIVAMVEAAAKKANPRWIYGRGWHQENGTSSRRRTSRAFRRFAEQGLPNNPVRHACERLRELREREGDGDPAHERYAEPPGGDIIRDAKHSIGAGEPASLIRRGRGERSGRRGKGARAQQTPRARVAGVCRRASRRSGLGSSFADVD